MMIVYQTHNCMLQVLVHDDCIPNAQLHVTGLSTLWFYHLHFACYGIGTIIFLIVTVNKGLSYYSTYRSRLCFSNIDRFCMNFISSHFCWVICSSSFFAIDSVQGELVLENSVVLCTSLSVWLRLRPECSINLLIWLLFVFILPNSYTIINYCAPSYTVI